MSSNDHKPASELRQPNSQERISFRDYPSTGVVVLAALVSGLSWLVYKWSNRKRRGQSPAHDHPQEAEKTLVQTLTPGHGDASAEPKSDPS